MPRIALTAFMIDKDAYVYVRQEVRGVLWAAFASRREMFYAAEACTSRLNLTPKRSKLLKLNPSGYVKIAIGK